MTQKIGPREEQLRAMRERQFDGTAARPVPKVVALRENVAAIPARKPPKQKKAKR